MRLFAAASGIALFAVAGCDARRSTGAAAATDAVAAAVLPSASPAPPAPPYDLDADLAARVAVARASLGASAAFDVEGDVFLLATARRGRLHDASVKLARDALAAYFDRRFATRPALAITVYVLDSRPAYDALCRTRVHVPCDTLGLYDPVKREILVDASPGVTREGFEGGQRDLHYAMARYLCQWMDERGWLWGWYRTWRDTVATDPRGEAAFTGVTGMTPAQANDAWVKWVRAL